METTVTLTSSTARVEQPLASARTVRGIELVDGELRTSTEVAFAVRPLNGPGTMGPTVLSEASDAPLEEVRAYLVAHPDGGPLRIEASVNPMRMSSSPDASWPAGLSLQIARWLVERGIDCKRLAPIGWLDKSLDGKERVRFLVGPAHERPPGEEARRDACAR